MVSASRSVRAASSAQASVAGLDGGAEGVDDAEEQVARDVLEVAPEAQPRPGGGDVVGGALARRLHEDGQLDVVLDVLLGEHVRAGGNVTDEGHVAHRAALHDRP